MRSIISESPNGKQRIIIDPSSERVTFIGCFPAKATSFFDMPQPHPKFVCRFEDILNVKVWRGKGSWLYAERLRPKRIVTAHGSVSWGGDWTNIDEAWDMLRAISESTPDAPMLPAIAACLFIGVLAILVLIVILFFYWLTGM